MKPFSLGSIEINGQRTGIRYDALTRALLPKHGKMQHVNVAVLHLWNYLRPNAFPLSIGEMIETLANEGGVSRADIVDKALWFFAGHASQSGE
jgi:hypothetical protein